MIEVLTLGYCLGAVSLILVLKIENHFSSKKLKTNKCKYCGGTNE